MKKNNKIMAISFLLFVDKYAQNVYSFIYTKSHILSECAEFETK